GEPFMVRYDPRAELAPRDIVARAIDNEMKVHGWECVYLDISHRDPDWIRTRFPTVTERCLRFGFDLTRGPVPVVPAAHYCSGGARRRGGGGPDTGGRARPSPASTPAARTPARGSTAPTGWPRTRSSRRWSSRSVPRRTHARHGRAITRHRRRCGHGIRARRRA